MNATSAASKGDAFTVILWGAAAAIITVIAAIEDTLATFTADGLALSMRLEPGVVSGVVQGTATAVAGLATEMTVVAEVNAVSAACAAASIVVRALAQLAVIAAAMHLAWSFLRGRIFDRSTVRDLYAISLAVGVGAVAVLMLDRMAHNGMLQALSLDETEPLHPRELWAITPYVFASIAVSLLAVAFRRGIQLQRDTEGLV